MTMVCTPSSNWQGTEQDGSRWTTQQVSVLMKMGKDPLVVRTATILRAGEVDAVNWFMAPPKVEVVLPCLMVTKDGKRAKVVLPSGWTQWMELARGR
jgi:hypothetical protein